MSIKRILGVFGALMTLAVVGAVVWISTFNPNDYKALAVEQAEKAGWKLTINGDLSMSLWPQLAIDLPPIELAALNANQSIAAQTPRFRWPWRRYCLNVEPKPAP